jgi:WD40 repeat protein
MSTIFISHSSKNNEVARDIEGRLAHQNHPSVFLDLDPEKGILAGQSWERTLYRKLRACRAVIAVLTDDYLSSHWCFAEVALARMMGKNIFALKVEGLSDGAKLPSILTEQQYIDLRTDPTDGYKRLWAGLQEEDVLGIGGAYDPRKDGPYLGLAAFEEKHAAMFFGREDETRAGLEALERGSPGLIMVLGASGSGKSSLVRAGIVPRLRRQPERWIVVDPVRPGVDPFAELATALERTYAQVAAARGVKPPTPGSIADRLRAGAARLPRPSSEYTSLGREVRQDPDVAAPDSSITVDQRLQQLMKHLEGLQHDPPAHADDAFRDFLDWSVEDLRHIVTRSPAGPASTEFERERGTALLGIARHLRRFSGSGQPRVVVIVDQFEELFGHGSEDLANRFLTLLRTSVDVEQNVLMVVGTMRSDYLDVFQRHPSLRGVEYGSLSLGPMQVGNMRHVIEKPAELADIELEAGLADELLKDTGQPDALPLLSFTLWKLYRDYAADRKLEKREYQQLGGLHGAIAKEAATVAQVAENREREDDLRKAFLRMARITEDRSSYARQPASVDDPAIRRVEPILRRFAERRLVVFRKEGKSEFVEVAHEALFRSWEPLTKWLDNNRAELLLRDQIQRDALAWDSEKRAADNLWRGARLLQARELMKHGTLPPVEAQFIRAGVRRRLRQRWTLLATVAAVFAGVALAAVSAQIARIRAEDATRVSMAAEWLARGEATNAALALLDVRKPAGSLLAASRMAGALENGIARLELRGHPEGVYRATFKPVDGARIITGGRDGAAIIWDAESGAPLDTLCCADGTVTGAALGPDGRTAVTAALTSAWIWDLGHASRAPTELGGHAAEVNTAVFSPDGAWIATASDDGTARLWLTGRPDSTITLSGHTGAVVHAGFSWDGHRVASSSADGTVRVWNTSTGLEQRRLGHDNGATAAAFSRDGTWMATATGDGAVHIWDLETGTESRTLYGHTASVHDLAISTDGLLATAGLDFTVRLWSGRTGDSLRVIAEHTDQVLSVAFSPDGTRLVTASDDQTARVWDTGLRNRDPGSGFLVGKLLLRPGADVATAAFSPSGDRVVTASRDSTATIWDSMTGEVSGVLAHPDAVNSAVFAPGGERILTASDDHAARTWSATTHDSLMTFTGHSDTVIAASFSPDGRLVATASFDGTARIWDAATGAARHTLRHDRVVYAVAFSPDGRRLATATDTIARLWDVGAGTLRDSFVGHSDVVLSVSFSNDGKRLITAGDDFTAIIWEVRSGEPLARLTGHQDWIQWATFSPDDRWVATASGDLTVRIWDAASGLAVWSRESPAAFRSAVFSPDGGRLAAVGRDSVVTLWDVGLHRLWRVAQQATSACLSPTLRRQIGMQIGKSENDAVRQYRACERRHGRTP